LDGQPRAIVFHEKEGRRHAHCVWSRIDAQTMTARPLPYFKRKLMEVSRELYLEHGWKLPRGFENPRGYPLCRFCAETDPWLSAILPFHGGGNLDPAIVYCRPAFPLDISATASIGWIAEQQGMTPIVELEATSESPDHIREFSSPHRGLVSVQAADRGWPKLMENDDGRIELR
jgi:hypothetical protein